MLRAAPRACAARKSTPWVLWLRCASTSKTELLVLHVCTQQISHVKRMPTSSRCLALLGHFIFAVLVCKYASSSCGRTGGTSHGRRWRVCSSANDSPSSHAVALHILSCIRALPDAIEATTPQHHLDHCGRLTRHRWRAARRALAHSIAATRNLAAQQQLAIDQLPRSRHVWDLRS